MWRRIQTVLAIVSFALFSGLLWLWIDGGVVTLLTHRGFDVRSQLFCTGPSLQIDYTGLRSTLRDWRHADFNALVFGPCELADADKARQAAQSGYFRFGRMNGYVESVPMQDLRDAARRPISQSQTYPLQLLTVPAWLVLLLFTLLPAWSLHQTRKCGQRCRPIHWLRRRKVMLSLVFMGVIVMLAWSASYFGLKAIAHGNHQRAKAMEVGVRGIRFGSVGWGGPYNRTEGVISFLVSPYTARVWIDRCIGPIIYTAVDDDLLDWEAFLPCWLLLLLPIMILLSTAAMRLWGKRFREGHCPTCDYDLRASVDRCPECGSAIKTDIQTPRRWKQWVWFLVAAGMLGVSCVIARAWMEGRTDVVGLIAPRSLEGTRFKLGVDRGTMVIDMSTQTQLRPFHFDLPVWIPLLTLLALSAGAGLMGVSAGKVKA